MAKAITINGSMYTITGTVINQENNQGIADLHVLTYDKDVLMDDFLGIAKTNTVGEFTLNFDTAQFQSIFDKKPDLYFIVKDAGLELLNTKENLICNADTTIETIDLKVNIEDDRLRREINQKPVEGWVGGFAESNPAFAYPTPDLTSLPMQDNLDNIPKLQRQQKVLWPEFSWETEPGEADPKRCYQMFAPDISRLGYTNEGRVYSIICPQQGICSPNLGTMNVEVTVTGNRGWANEANKELAADMSVVGKIWFGPAAKENKILKQIAAHFDANNLDFPFSKANAIVVRTYKPGEPDQPIFPLTKGLTEAFPIPDFAKHEGVAWTKGHLGVEIGTIEKTGREIVDDFNQLVLDIFNTFSGNMLQNKNILTWNVWFTAPELVDTQEWADHAEKWRQSIEADHGSPEGPGTTARFFDGTPFKAINHLVDEELIKITAFIEKHL